MKLAQLLQVSVQRNKGTSQPREQTFRQRFQVQKVRPKPHDRQMELQQRHVSSMLAVERSAGANGARKINSKSTCYPYVTNVLGIPRNLTF